MSNFIQTSIVVGVVPRQPEGTVSAALSWAKRCDADLVHFVYANPRLVEVEGRIEPLDPDSLNESWEHECDLLADHVLALARSRGVRADFEYVAGSPARGISRVAHEYGSILIVVGTRRRGALAAAQEWAHGSVAARLALSQDIPVMVVPLAAIEQTTLGDSFGEGR